jgi:signal transduction histidine kinase
MSATAASEATEGPELGRPAARRLLRRALPLAALPAVYYASAKVGYAIGFAGPVAAIVWLPVGVGIAFLYLGGIQLWPGVVIGDLLANDYGTLPLGSALGQTVGNLLEVLVAVVLMRRLIGRASPLGSVPALARMLAALAAGTAVSATIGTVSLRLGDVIDAGTWAHVWRTWWLGDFAGALIVVPLAVAWVRGDEHGGWRGGPVEAALVVVAVVALSELAFRGGAPLTYIVFPALLWAVLRFGQRGATVAVAIAAAVTVYDTSHYSGPFSFDSITRTVLSTQLYIAVAALSSLVLAAVVTERERFADRLGASRARLVEAGDTARRRFERDLHDGAQQRLTALAVSLGAAAVESEAHPERAPALFDAAGEDLGDAIAELRQLAHGLHPIVLSALGLASAIRDVALRSTVPVRIAELPSGRLDPTAEATAYFVFAEALTNAQRHARAGTVRVRMFVALRSLHVIVADDGIGGAREAARSGLQGLRDRVEATGGRFEVSSPPGGGTTIRASIPLAAANGDGAG